MLISSLQDTVRALRRPAKRRSRAVTVDSQDLEPRLFLSVNSLLSSAESVTEWSDSTDIAVATFDESDPTTGGVSEEEEGSETEPAFESVSSGYDENGDFVVGSVQWPENPSDVEGLEVEVFDSGGNEMGSDVTDANGDFMIYIEEGLGTITVRLKNHSGEVVDETYLSL